MARHRLLWTAAALTLAGCPAPPPAPTGSEPAGAVEIRSDRATWSTVTVRAGDDRIHFDALGVIHRVDVDTRDGGRPIEAAPALSSDFLARHPNAISHTPAISPDGRYLAFISDAGGRENVWIAQPGGGREKRLSDLSGATISGLAWMPSGRALVARVRDEPTRGALWRFPLAGEAAEIETASDLQDLQGPHPHDGWIYFATTFKPPGSRPLRREHWQIARMPAGGGRVEPVVDSEGGAVRPRISPDGRWLTYVTWRRGRSQLVLRNRLTQSERILAEVGRNLQDIYIAQLDLFPGYTLTNRAVWVSIDGAINRIDLATGKQRSFAPRFSRRIDPPRPARPPISVPDSNSNIRMFRWPDLSADGGRLVFEALGQIWLVNQPFESKPRPRALTPEAENCAQPNLSPDADRVVFVCELGDGRWRIEMIALADESRTTVAGKQTAWAAPRWVGNNDRLVAVRSAPLPALGILGEPVRSIVTMDPDGTNRRQIATAKTGAGGAWPVEDGRAFVYRDQRDLVRWSGESGTATRVADFGRASSAVPHPDGSRWLVQIDGHVLEVPQRRLQEMLSAVNEGQWGFSDYPGEIGEFPVWTGGSGYLYTRPGRIEFRDGGADRRIEIELTVDPPRHTGTLALTHGRLITMDDRGVIEDGHVVVADGEIVRVGASDSIQLPEDARTIDLRGRTVIPGLIDVHQHALYLMGFDPLANIPREFSPAAALLSHGVTATRDPALFDNARDFAIIEQINAGRIAGPRYFATGQRLRPDEYPVRSAADAEAAVGHVADFGATAIKQYLYPDRRQRQWIADAARARVLRSAFESGYDYKLGLSALLDGFNSIEHSPGNHALLEDFIGLASAVDVDYVPTLMTQIGAQTFYDQTDIDAQPRLEKWLPAAWRLQLENRRRRGAGVIADETAYATLARNAYRMTEAGVDVGVGAHDNPSPTGLGTLWEVAALVEGGMDESQALRSATIEGARILGIDHRTGSITAGKLADLVVLDGNPLENIRALEDTAMIVFRGQVLDPLTLQPIQEREP